ncbi:EAL domain-containing protein [Wenzhouxiangella sp. EGI_FJ10409]|uniref:EAL domain-containing protein n=1 Tax=Wenzhouxiangella sp. EGI_FJ10409 TaxID=3243767 RepID=UPI0035DFB7B8
MNLDRLSRFSVAVCVAGMLLLLVLSIDSGQEIYQRQEAIGELLELSARIDEFSAASDSLVLFGADPGRWKTYVAEAKAIRRELEEIGELHPDARKAARRVAQLVDSVEAALQAGEYGNELARPDRYLEPLEVPARSRIVMHQVAGQGIALDSALDRALRERQRAITREATWIGATLAGAALLFGALCVVAFALIHRRIAHPVRLMANTLERRRAGENDARAPVTGNDELSRLAETLNRTLDERDAAQKELKRQGALLDVAGRAARFGAWAVNLDSMTCEWSDVVAEIHGMPRGYTPSVEEGIHFYAPEFRERISQVFEACAEQGESYDEELQVVDAEGQRRWVRTVGEPVYDKQRNIIRVQGAFQDISERKALEQESRHLSDRLAAMLEAITDGFVAFDEQWRYTYVNAEGGRILGKSRDELIGSTLWDQFPELAGSATERALVDAMEARISTTADEFFEPLQAWFDVHAYPWTEGIAVFFRDVTENHRMLERLQAHEAALRASRDELDAALGVRQALINSLPAHIAMLDKCGKIMDVNDQWRHFGEQNQFRNGGSDFGVGTNYVRLCEAAEGECSKEAQTVADGLKDVLGGKRETFALEYPCHSPDKKRWFRAMFSRLTSAGSAAGGAVAMHIDITQRKLAEQELNRLAYEDSLTGLHSRNGFAERLGQRFERDEWPAGGIVAMLDVVGQHDINDAHGYEAGDRVLVELGRRLQHRSGEQGLAGRTGGDEFVVYLPDASGISADDRLRHIAAAVDEPFHPDETGLDIEVAVRIGYTLLGGQRRSPQDLVREAELALFENRDDDIGETPWLAFSEGLNKQTRERIQLTSELRRALEADEFELHFQPKVSLGNGRMIAAEALIRWQHPERGLLPPGVFIPVAEQSQLIGPIGDWVLRAACRQLRGWQDAGLTTVRVAVNVSQIQFMIGDFPAKVRAALAEFDVDASQLSLEITESVFERQSDRLLAELRDLSNLGVRLALDDFGTGYSSLLYLQRYPFDEIKIDQGFVNRLLDDRYSRDIVRAIMNLAWALDAEAVAEGIETKEVAEALLEMGCYEGQGYYYSMPLAGEDFRWLLEKRSNLPLGASDRDG